MKFRRQKQKPAQELRRSSQPGSRPVVFSYYARANNPANEQNTGRNEASSKPRIRLASLPTYMALTVIVLAVLYSCLLHPTPHISLLNQAGTIYRPTEEYQKVINAIWQRTVFNKTKLTIRSEEIQQDIKSQFNEVESVKIELPLLGHRPKVTLVPARPALQFVSSNGAFYVDTRGKVMARTTEVVKNQIDLPVVIDETGIPADPGKAVVAESEAIFLQKLAGHLKAENIAYESVVLPSTAAKEADVRLSGQGYYLKFSILTDPRQAVGSYIAIRDKLLKDNITPAEYIDLRVAEKVFYK